MVSFFNRLFFLRTFNHISVIHCIDTDAQKNIEGTPSKTEKLGGIIASQKSEQRKGEFNALSSVFVPPLAVSSPSWKQKNIVSKDENSCTRDIPNESAEPLAVSSSKKKNDKKRRDSGAEKSRSSKMSRNQSKSNASNHNLSLTKKTKKQKNKRRTFELEGWSVSLVDKLSQDSVTMQSTPEQEKSSPKSGQAIPSKESPLANNPLGADELAPTPNPKRNKLKLAKKTPSTTPLILDETLQSISMKDSNKKSLVLQNCEEEEARLKTPESVKQLFKKTPLPSLTGQKSVIGSKKKTSIDGRNPSSQDNSVKEVPEETPKTKKDQPKKNKKSSTSLMDTESLVTNSSGQALSIVDETPKTSDLSAKKDRPKKGKKLLNSIVEDEVLVTVATSAKSSASAVNAQLKDSSLASKATKMKSTPRKAHTREKNPEYWSDGEDESFNDLLAKTSDHKKVDTKVRKTLIPSQSYVDEPVASTSRTPLKRSKGKAIRKPVPHVEPRSSDDTEDEERLVTGAQSKSKPNMSAKTKQRPSSRSVNCHSSSSDSSDVDQEHLIQEILASSSVTKKSTSKKKRRSRTTKKNSEEDIDMNKAIENVMKNLVGSDSDDQDEKSKNEEKEVHSSETRESPKAACSKSLTKKRPKVKLYIWTYFLCCKIPSSFQIRSEKKKVEENAQLQLVDLILKESGVSLPDSPPTPPSPKKKTQKRSSSRGETKAPPQKKYKSK